jgi:fimbrial chaperone protein
MGSKILAIFVMILSLPLVALRVELSNDTFSTTGRAANRNLFVTNNSEKMIALEVYAQSREIDPNSGVDLLEDVEDFLIYPNQLLLQPDEQQVVTLTWVGPQSITDELAFRIIVEELNLSLGEDGLEDEEMTVKLAALTKVIKAAYVAPGKAKANVTVLKSEVIAGDDQDKKIKITLNNTGTAHKILKQTNIEVVALNAEGNKIKESAIRFIPNELQGVLNILAKSQRVITIDWPEGMSNDISNVHVSL